MEAEPGPASGGATFPKAEAWLVVCTTGCSCCASENHVRGPFRTREVAEARVEFYTSTRLLASQYARSGVYGIVEAEAEVLPDGRLIVEDHVCSGFVVNDLVAGLSEEIFSQEV